MLVAQAKHASDLFLNTVRADDCIEEITTLLSRQTQNIALIGMPGSGKSTTGKCLADLLGRPFVDCDALFAELYQQSPAEVIRSKGERTFREMETRVLERVSKQSGTVIATGGGVVTQPQNLPLLRQNSVVVFLRRDLRELPVDNRPLSQQTGIAALAQVRMPLYTSWADFSVSCVGPEKTAEEIKKELKL